MPNADRLPHLHAILARKGICEYTQPLQKSQVTEDYLSRNVSSIEAAYEKIIAVLRLILNNDRHAAQLALLSLVSRVNKREGGMLIGDLAINL